jgi:hypothetical protein
VAFNLNFRTLPKGASGEGANALLGFWLIVGIVVVLAWMVKDPTLLLARVSSLSE